jgi:hypothetical protein
MDSGYSETSVPEHTHFCSGCDSTWICNDDACEGDQMYLYQDWGAKECPLCETGERDE